MRKYVLLAFIIVLLIILTIPWFMGYHFKKQLFALVEYSNKFKENHQTRIVSYDLGWLHSTARIESTIKSSFDGTLTTKTDSVISHGPIVYNKIKESYGFEFASTTDKTEITFNNNGITLPLTTINTNGVLDFNNTFDYMIHIPKIVFPLGTWDGLTAITTTVLKNNEIEQTSLRTKIGTLNIQTTEPAHGQPISLNTSPITFDCDAKMYAHYQCSFNLPRVTLNYANKPGAIINDFVMTTKSDITNNQYSGVMNGKINKISLPQFLIPEVSLLALNISINNLNAKEMRNPNNLQLFYGTPLNLNIFTPQTAVTTALSFNSTFGKANLNSSSDWKALANQKSPSADVTAKSMHTISNIKVSVPLLKKIVEWLIPFYPDYYQILQKEENATTNASTNAAPQQGAISPTKDQFNQEIATLVQHQQLDLPTAISLMNAHDNHAPKEAFAKQVADLKLDEPTKNLLIQLNDQNSIASIVPAPQTPKTQTPEEQALFVVNAWLKKGYLVQVDNDYTANATIENGVLHINGKVIQ